MEEKDFNESGGEIIKLINDYKYNIESIVREPPFTEDIRGLSIFETVIKKSKNFLSNIDKKTFIDLYVSNRIIDKKIISDIVAIINTYKSHEWNNRLYKVIDKDNYLNDAEFITKFGPPPWQVFNYLCKILGLSLEIIVAVDKTNPSNPMFSTHVFNTLHKTKVGDFNNLSSGEKVLISLVNSIYTSNQGYSLPKLILLDEIDSVLNPSVLRQVIDFLTKSFADNGIKIIIATHQPSTVAFAPEESVYKISTSSKVPIKKMKSNEAIKDLSEGYVTLSELLEFNKYEKQTIIISEGKNYHYLKKANDLFGDTSTIDIVELREINTGALRNLFDFIRCLNNQKKFVFVFDCDYRLNQSDNKNIKPRDLKTLKSSSNKNNRVFIFEENNDGCCESGIENLIDRKHIRFDLTGNKDRIRNEILKMTDLKNVLINFKPLFDFIDSNKNHNL